MLPEPPGSAWAGGDPKEDEDEDEEEDEDEDEDEDEEGTAHGGGGCVCKHRWWPCHEGGGQPTQQPHSSLHPPTSAKLSIPLPAALKPKGRMGKAHRCLNESPSPHPAVPPGDTTRGRININKEGEVAGAF